MGVRRVGKFPCVPFEQLNRISPVLLAQKPVSEAVDCSFRSERATRSFRPQSLDPDGEFSESVFRIQTLENGSAHSLIRIIKLKEAEGFIDSAVGHKSARNSHLLLETMR